MAAQTVTPLPKPGTELTAYALPTPDGAATSAAAALAAQTAGSPAAASQPVATQTVAGASPATASTGDIVAASAPAQPAPSTALALANTEVASLSPARASANTNPLLVSTTATDALPSSADPLITVQKVRVQPGIAGMTMSAMDSDFDTGEPVGLETLVAKRMIVPAPKPQLIAVAYSKVESAASALLGRSKPTSSRPELDKLITQYAKLNGIPEDLVHRVVRRESTYNPRAYHNGNYGLMQIRYNTAKGLGYEGPPEGLFDAETNLKYATQYLRGAWVVAENQNDNAVKLYASGYYYHAKRKGLLDTLNMR